MSANAFRLVSAFAMASVLAALATRSAHPQESPEKFTADELAKGKRLFVTHCSRCHGILGGGGLGPGLTGGKLRYAPDFPALLNVISNGLPNSAMPGAWQLWGRDVKLVAGYVHSLGQVSTANVPGDPARGKTLFEVKGACTTCHIVRNQGGTLGPVLTDVGMRRGPDYLRKSLIDPNADMPEESGKDSVLPGFAQYLPVSVETRDGREIQGVRVNEDDFSIQLRDATNRIYSLPKNQLKALRKEIGKSIMPSYESVLTSVELDDLVAYLASLKGE